MLVVAHPDDEVLGPGGTVNRLVNNYNVELKVIILGEGITSRSENRDRDKWQKQLEKHRTNILEAKERLGYSSLTLYDLPDNRFDTIALLDIIKIIEKEKIEFSPEVIFTHHGGDVNIDHQRCFEAVLTACRPTQNEVVKNIITFETMSGTEWRSPTDPNHFLPNLFVEIDEDNLTAKILAMEEYEFEKRNYPHPRSSEAIKIRAQMWGVANGTSYAEAFCLVRSIAVI